MYAARRLASAAAGHFSTIAPQSAPRPLLHLVRESFSTAAPVYPVGRPIRLFGSLFSVMTTTFVTCETVPLRLVATAAASAGAFGVGFTAAAGVADADGVTVTVTGAELPAAPLQPVRLTRTAAAATGKKRDREKCTRSFYKPSTSGAANSGVRRSDHFWGLTVRGCHITRSPRTGRRGCVLEEVA